MNKHVKGALIFTGGAITGVTIGSVGMLSKMIQHDDIRTGITKAIADKVVKLMYGDEDTLKTYNRVSYRRYADSKPVGYQFDNVLFPTRDNAEKVMSSMLEILNRCGVVTVSDLYELGSHEAREQDYHYGWTYWGDIMVKGSLKNGGWYIDLPEPKKLD